MKTISKGCLLILFTVAAVFSARKVLLAQDPLALAPQIYSLLLENDRVRVCDIQFKPGDKIATHAHPDHLLYILSPGTIKLTRPDGTASEITAEAGQVLWSGAESHASENVGVTEVHAIIVELKS